MPELMHTDDSKAISLLELFDPMALVGLRASMLLIPSRHACVENR